MIFTAKLLAMLPKLLASTLVAHLVDLTEKYVRADDTPVPLHYSLPDHHLHNLDLILIVNPVMWLRFFVTFLSCSYST